MEERPETEGHLDERDLVLAVVLSMPRDPDLRNLMLDAVAGPGIIAQDRGGVVLRESAAPAAFSQLLIVVDPYWLAVAAGLATYAGSKVLDGFVGEPLKDMGVRARKRTVAAARTMFKNLGKAIGRVRKALPKPGVVVTVFAVASTGEERQYDIPANDVQQALCAIADDLLQPNQFFKQRHWVDGQWIDASSYLEGDARRIAEERRTLPTVPEPLESIRGSLGTYGPLRYRSLGSAADFLIEVPVPMKGEELDDFLDALREHFPGRRVGLDDSRKHARVTEIQADSMD